MKKSGAAMVFAVLAAVSFTNGVWALPFDDFAAQIQATAGVALKPFAADLGGLIGGADFNSGRAVGFPGFDAGFTGMVQTRPDSGNLILKNAGVKAFGIGMLQASAGLPVVGADIVLRGVTYSGFSIIGGGARYPVLKSGTLTKFIPDVSVSAFYDAVNFKYFTGSHISLDAAASFELPVIKPFAGVGYESTKVETKGMSAVLNGLKGSASNPRVTVGARLSPFPFLYVFGAYNLLHGNTGINFGFGARF